MPDLSDFIGQLAASVTRARMQADLEAIRVAELYANHPYLRHFPIPRFRLPSIEMDVPIIIDKMEESPPENSPAETLKPEVIIKEANSALGPQLQKHKIALNKTQMTQLQNALAKAIKNIERINEASIEIGEITKIVSREAVDFLKRIAKISNDQLAPFAKDFSRSLNIRLLNLRKIPPRIKVLVQTSQIQEASKNDALVNLRFNMSEDAVEWTMVEIQGDEVERLLPE